MARPILRSIATAPGTLPAAVTIRYRSTNFGISTDKPVTGDFDGDGSYDVAIYRDGDWWIVNSLTGTVRSLHWGLASDIPVPADYDKDGITDIAVFRPSNGDWYILKSTTNSLVGSSLGY